MRLPGTVAELADDLLAGVELTHALRLRVDGCVIDVTTDEPRVARRLRDYFSELVTDEDGSDPADFRITAVQGPILEAEADWTIKEPGPGKTKLKEEWVDLPDGRVVRKRLTGLLFAFGGDLHLAFGPCLENDNQIVNFINNRYMQWRLAQGFLLAHAGAVGRDGRVLALCGPSGAGKSTVALALVAEGLDFVSNDRLLLRADGDGIEVYGIPKHPRVNPGTVVHNPLLHGLMDDEERSRLLELPDERLQEVEDKYDVLIDRLPGEHDFRMHGVLEALVVFNWGDGAEPSSREIDLAARRELLPLITKSPGLFYEPEDGQSLELGDDRYVELLSSARVVEIHGRQDFDAATRLCGALFDTPAPAAG